MLFGLLTVSQWKKYLTTMQITQFIIDIFVVYFGTSQHFFFRHGINLPWVRDCAGAESAALFGCALLTSYLFLFIAFYKKTYKAGAAKKAAAKKTNVSGSRNDRGAIS